MRSKWKLLTVLGLILASLSSTFACSPARVNNQIVATSTSKSPCYLQSKEFESNFEKLWKEWDDANNVAQATARINLGPAVAQLQTIRRNVSDLDAPPCASNVKALVIDYMNNIIDNYLAFMADNTDLEIQKLSAATDSLNKFVTEYGKLKAGQPPYDQ